MLTQQLFYPPYQHGEKNRMRKLIDWDKECEITCHRQNRLDEGKINCIYCWKRFRYWQTTTKILKQNFILVLSMGTPWEALALAPAAPPPPSLIYVFTPQFLIVFFSLLCMGDVLVFSQICSQKCHHLAWQVLLCPVAGLLQNGPEPAGSVSGIRQPWLPFSKVISEATCCQYLAMDTPVEKLLFQFVWL